MNDNFEESYKMAQPKKVNYLNNKDILKEIHKSKMTFCWTADEKYSGFDVILEDVNKINRNSIKYMQHIHEHNQEYMKIHTNA